VSHQVPPQVADMGMLSTYVPVGGGYQGNKILGANQNCHWCPAAGVRSRGAMGMGLQQKKPGPPDGGLCMRVTTSACITYWFRNLQHGLG
jgi:hypothetical protein